MNQATGIQDAVKSACSISYLSDKLGISRPTLYRYMDLYAAGSADRVPGRVRGLLDFIAEGDRSEEDVILYFMRGPAEEREDLRARVVSDGGRVMVMFPDAGDEAVVKVYADFDGEREAIAEFRPSPGSRYVTVDDLVAGQRFYVEVRSGDRSSGQIPFELKKRCGRLVRTGGIRGRPRFPVYFIPLTSRVCANGRMDVPAVRSLRRMGPVRDKGRVPLQGIKRRPSE